MYSLTELNRLHDEARHEAERLRRAAIDDLWRGTGALLATASTQALRSAERLRYRLLRRRAMPTAARPQNISA